MGADSMGAMGTIAPTAKKLREGGDVPKSVAPQEFCYVSILNDKMSLFLHVRIVHSQNAQKKI